MKQFFSSKTIASIFLILCTLSIVLVITCVGFTNKNILFQTLEAHHDSFSELYFQNNENILSKPAKITDFTAVPYSFSFSIHNLENKPMKYSYVVSLSGYENKTIDSKTVWLEDSQATTIKETVILPNKIPTRTKITVTLANKNQEIFFWIGGNE